MQDFSPGQEYQFVVDVDPASFELPEVQKALQSAKTIFVNAVMGLMPAFWHGTSKMDEAIDRNTTAQKFFGGGDTLQEFKRYTSCWYPHDCTQWNIEYTYYCSGKGILASKDAYSSPVSQPFEVHGSSNRIQILGGREIGSHSYLLSSSSRVATDGVCLDVALVGMCSLHPGLYQAALDSLKYYLFTGGGTVLKVLEEGDPSGLPTVKALIANGKQYGYQHPSGTS